MQRFFEGETLFFDLFSYSNLIITIKFELLIKYQSKCFNAISISI